MPLIFLCIGGFILITLLTSISDGKTPSPGTIIPAMMGAIIGGMILLGIIACWLHRRAFMRMADRMNALNVIIKKHQDSVFASKNCIIRLSPHQAYIAIEFKWRGPSPAAQNMMAFGVNPGINPAGMNPDMMAQNAGPQAAGMQINPWSQQQGFQQVSQT